MDITVIFKIAALGLVVAILNQLLQKAGKEEYTLLTTLAGLLIALTMLLPELSTLKDTLGAVMDF